MIRHCILRDWDAAAESFVCVHSQVKEKASDTRASSCVLRVSVSLWLIELPL